MAGPDMRVFVPLLLCPFLSSAVDSEPTTGGDDDFEGECDQIFERAPSPYRTPPTSWRPTDTINVRSVIDLPRRTLPWLAAFH